ncbi:MAG: hypothetical protein KME28_11050 [Pelatocladus maniniholoensis HA4357-MV3]|jgi:hypothetical protein|uniref:Uncharacterized protein n=1 Tax=Pelatocladus maniniholoensis HA4357-MV3 TaxID=1117104 RepID=A0A9E3H758_9NOST|nr:hypothetical protein [Pelatocladus maniniholoensis HA4357-MV3]BAZ66553.1 hypothetical protein NIES4106_13050 [Fischerella sp. NIES-4106]
MLAIHTREELTSNKSDKNNLEFLTKDVISSLLYHCDKSYKIINIQSNRQNSTEVVYRLPLQYQDANTLRLLTDYIHQIKNEIQQTKSLDKPQIIREKPIKSVDTLLKESSESNLQITQSRLIELLQEDNEDDEGFLKPTPYAFDKAWKLIADASQFMRNCFPKAWVSTNDEGGIRLTWSRLEKEAEVRLICGSEPNKPTYLYHEKGEKYGVVNDVSGLSLAGWLQWLDKV